LQISTKDETENWILEKLRSNTPKSTSQPWGGGQGLVYINYDYSFDDYNLIIKYETMHYKNKGGIGDGSAYHNPTKYKIVIPIYDIDRVYEQEVIMNESFLPKSSEPRFFIKTKKETIIEYNETSKTKRVTNKVTTDFNVKSETDICNRLNKARSEERRVG